MVRLISHLAFETHDSSVMARAHARMTTCPCWRAGCGTLGCVSTWLLPTPEFLSMGFLVTILTARACPSSLLQTDLQVQLRRQGEASPHHAVGVYVLGLASTGKTLLMNALLCGFEETGSCVVGRWNGHVRASATSVQSILENVLSPLSSGDLVCGIKMRASLSPASNVTQI